ncbi:MFS transporter [Tetragenococcus halophilus]|uniref:MFS transporter n=2 Tax=Tetragenococcus halophilus TaxID=51669 RepID=A0A3G5FM15_TETHA|nr:MFS transporter [Tetragenococcus halophilus]
MLTFVACMGMFLSTLDTGIMNVALPFLTQYFSTNENVAAMSVVGYTVSLAAVIMPLGSLSDQIGKLKISFFGFLLFGISSLLCGLAVNIQSLIIFRIFQGIGAAALQATSSALITSYVKKEQLNKALGTLGVAIGLGPVLGPSIGGLFLFLGAWRWIFWLNIPLVFITLFANIFLLKKIKIPATKIKHFDYKGVGLCLAAITFLLSGLNLVAKSGQMFIGITFMISALIVLVILIRVEKKQKDPLFHLQEYRKSKITLDLIETALFGFATSIIFLLPPFLLEQLLHVSSGKTGLYVLGAPIGLVLFSKISGNLNNGTKHHQFVRIGLITMSLSFLVLALTSQLWTPFLITFLLFLYGIGAGFFQPANIAIIMQSSSQKLQSEIGSLQRMVQNVGIATSTTIGSIILTLNFSLRTNLTIGWGLTASLLLLISLINMFQKNK